MDLSPPPPDPVQAFVAGSRAEDGAVLARVRHSRVAILRTRPGGRVALRLGDRTDFGSPTVLWVQQVRRGWGAVRHHRGGNRRLLWLRLDSPALRLSRTRWSIRVDRSARRLELRHGRRLVRRISVDVGRPGSPTPTGRYHVTDKLSGRRFGGVYGCCVLALSAVQNRVPAGWAGGNRMAIHGTPDGHADAARASAGCVRANDGDLRAILRRVPLGTPVAVRA